MGPSVARQRPHPVWRADGAPVAAGHGGDQRLSQAADVLKFAKDPVGQPGAVPCLRKRG
jgi:hypothetical protein